MNRRNSNAKGRLRVLLIDDDSDDALIARELLDPAAFDLQWAETLDQGIARAQRGAADVVLLDLNLPESQGFETFSRFRGRVSDLPIVVMTGLDDEACAVKAVREGAQDYLVKGQTDAKRLASVLRYAVERHESHLSQRDPALTDRLTGLYNRRGFITLIEQQLRMAQRTKRGFFVFFAVVDGLFGINEAFGKPEGNNALKTTAEILRESFRTSDVIARVGTDSFAIVTPDIGQYNPKLLTARLQKSQTYYNAQYNRYRLSISVCATLFDPLRVRSAKDVLRRSDRVLADYRRRRQGSSDVIVLK